MFKQMPHLDIVKILGVEQLIRRYIVEILAVIRQYVDPYVLQMTTNGMLGDRLEEALHKVAWPGLQLRISVDGPVDTHDEMRGVSGSWRVVDETLRRIKPLQKRYGFKLGINFALTDDSMDTMGEMVDYAKEMGADLIPGVNVSPFLSGAVPPEELPQKVVMLSDNARALRLLKDTRVGANGQLPLMDRLMSRFMTHSTFEHQLAGNQLRFTCRELRDLVYVLPNGDLVRCGVDHKPVGNLVESTFADVWSGHRAAELRNKVDDCPGCLQASVQILSRLYGGCLTGW